MWSKFDDQFYLNPKIAVLDRDEQDLYMAGIIYCNGQLTDGFIPTNIVTMLCIWAKILNEANTQANAQAIASHLVEHGLWEISSNGYMVHDFLDWNPSREEVLAKREARSEAGRRGGNNSVAVRQANAQANAQAKLKQSSTPSPSPSQYQYKEEELQLLSPSPSTAATVIYNSVAGGFGIPITEQENICQAIAQLSAKFTEKEALIEYLRPFYAEYKNRYHGGGSAFWLLDWAMKGEIPPVSNRNVPPKGNGNGKQPAAHHEETKEEFLERRAREREALNGNN